MPAKTTSVALIPARTLRHAERAISLLLAAELHDLDANTGAPVLGESEPAGRRPRQVDDHALATHGPRRPAIGDPYPDGSGVLEVRDFEDRPFGIRGVGCGQTVHVEPLTVGGCLAVEFPAVERSQAHLHERPSGSEGGSARESEK